MEQVLRDLINLTGHTDQDAQVLGDVADKTQPWMEEVTQGKIDEVFWR